MVDLAKRDGFVPLSYIAEQEKMLCWLLINYHLDQFGTYSSYCFSKGFSTRSAYKIQPRCFLGIPVLSLISILIYHLCVLIKILNLLWFPLTLY